MKMRSEQRRLWAVLTGTALTILIFSGTGYVLQAKRGSDGAAGPELSVAPTADAPPTVTPAPTKVVSGSTLPTKSGPATRTTKADPNAGPAIIRWIRKFTPAGGGQGGLNNVYALFMQRDCAGTLDAARVTGTNDGNLPLEEPYRSLYEGAAAACLAGLHGRTGLWPLALKLFDAVDSVVFNCWHGQVHTVFKTLVEAHRGNRSMSVNAREPLSAGCPEITGLEPNHGPRSGGYTVTVSGRNLPQTLDLLWRDINVTVAARRTTSGTAIMTVPPVGPDVSPDIIIMIDGAPTLDPLALVSFRYDD